MAFSIFFFASSRCSAGDPVSLGPDAPGRFLVSKEGRSAMSDLRRAASSLFGENQEKYLVNMRAE